MNFCKYLLKGKKKLDKKVFVNPNYTYSQLFEDVQSLTKSLKVFDRQIIGISFENSYSFIIFYLSIIKKLSFFDFQFVYFFFRFSFIINPSLFK